MEGALGLQDPRPRVQHANEELDEGVCDCDEVDDETEGRHQERQGRERAVQARLRDVRAVRGQRPGDAGLDPDWSNWCAANDVTCNYPGSLVDMVVGRLDKRDYKK